MDSLKRKKKKKVKNFEVIPENAPYMEVMEDTHITNRSIADESLSEEDVEFEQEELSHKRKDEGVVTDADRGSNGPAKDDSVPDVPGSSNKPFQRKPRKKTSSVWKYMEPFTANGVEGSMCKLCSQDFMKSDTSSTSSMKRHLEKCLKAHGATLQPQLQLQKGLGDEVQVSAFKYDHSIMREKVAHYVMINELPFLHVESFMWNEVMNTATPLYQKITRGTLKGDCRTSYEIEKKKLVEMFKSAQRINITTDMWTSTCQKIGYMVVTAHWIDKSWKLNSRVINFYNIPPPHSGDVISDAVNKCLVDWKIQDKIGTVTVDNAKANDVAIRNLKVSFSIREPSLPVEGKLFHMRCCAHILNLCVQDGLKPIVSIVNRVRDGVKYVGLSEGRRLKWAEISTLLQLKPKKLVLDVSTRWNTTYHMLHCALQFKQVFPRFARWDVAFKDYVPSEDDWVKVANVCTLLKVFDDATRIVSGSEYPTSNLFLSEVKMVKALLDKKAGDANAYMSEMASTMKEKFDKYWGESNLMMSIGAVMDPRFKMKLITYCFPIIDPADGQSEKNLAHLKVVLHALYQEYVAEDSRIKGMTLESTQISSSDNNLFMDDMETPAGMSEYEAFIRDSGAAVEPVKSELDEYLSENIFILNENTTKSFDVLSWWKGNIGKYPILSRMARDMLAVPMSTVASEATFSAGGRVIEPHRSCLKSETVEMLLCGADWARALYGLKKACQKKQIKPVEVNLY